jgi:hypothetical protein
MRLVLGSAAKPLDPITFIAVPVVLLINAGSKEQDPAYGFG